MHKFYVGSLEIAELKEEDMPMVNVYNLISILNYVLIFVNHLNL